MWGNSYTPGRQFLRRIRLWHLNAALWLVVLVSLGLYHTELSWAVRAFPAELRGEGYPSQPQWRMYNRAERLWEMGEDSSRAIELLERSLAIEPNPAPLHLLGRVHASEGHLEEAERLLLRLRAFDPSHLEGILDLSELYGELGRPDDRRRVLEEGLAWFESQEPLYRPVSDPTVWSGYNEKAEQVQADYSMGRRILEARLRLLASGQELLSTD